MEYLYLILIVFGINLIPAFAPPTWMVLVLCEINWKVNPIALVLLGAASAGLGRFLLAHSFSLLRLRIGEKTRHNLEAAGQVLVKGSTSRVLGLGLFLLSPFPSAQLFEAAGLMGVRLLPLTVAFFSGRLVSYSLYVTGAHQLQETRFGEVLLAGLKSPWGVGVQILSLACLYLLTRVNWHRFTGVNPD